MKKNTRKYIKPALIILTVLFMYLLPILLVNNNKELSGGIAVEVNKPLYNTIPNRIVTFNPLTVFYGSATAYVSNCPKCSGKLACNANYDISNGNVYFYDKTYGELRIVAADRKYPCGTILLASFGEVKTMVIVMDRGVGGNKLDLLSANLDDCKTFGYKRNIKYEVLRYGY